MQDDAQQKNEHFIYVYGGITDQPLETRRRQHILDNQPYGTDNSVLIERLLRLEIKGQQTVDQIKLAENFLINYLDERYPTILRNDRNLDGRVAQRGGAGIDPTIGKEYFVYVMYKTSPESIFV